MASYGQQFVTMLTRRLNAAVARRGNAARKPTLTVLVSMTNTLATALTSSPAQRQLDPPAVSAATDRSLATRGGPEIDIRQPRSSHILVEFL
jgi:hypothetical protein